MAPGTGSTGSTDGPAPPCRSAIPRPSHGAEMEGYFWRATDLEVSARAGRAVRGQPPPRRGLGDRRDRGRTRRLRPLGACSPGRTRRRTGSGSPPATARSRPTPTGSRWTSVRMPASSSRSTDRWAGHGALGGGGVFSAVPFLGQYWHPHLLGGGASGTAPGEDTWTVRDAEVYAEKNWGAGFPERWWWGQAHGFDRPDVCVAFSGGVLTAGPVAADRRRGRGAHRRARDPPHAAVVPGAQPGGRRTLAGARPRRRLPGPSSWGPRRGHRTCCRSRSRRAPQRRHRPRAPDRPALPRGLRSDRLPRRDRPRRPRRTRQSVRSRGDISCWGRSIIPMTRIERGRDLGVTVGDGDEPLQVRGGQLPRQRPRPLDLGVGEVGRAGDRSQASWTAGWLAARTRRPMSSQPVLVEDLAECDRLGERHGHALPEARVEGADRIAGDEVALRQRIELVVAVPGEGRERPRHPVVQRRRPVDDLVRGRRSRGWRRSA
jgi:hypothetical protein